MAILKEREEEEEDEDVKVPAKLEAVTKVRKMIEDLEDYFGKRRGASGVYLSYVIRAEAEPETGVTYATTDEEMIARVPLEGQYYDIDKATVWDVIRQVLYDTDGWSWVSEYTRGKDGRNAFLAIRAHYLGTSHQSRIKTEAERQIETKFYDGQKRGFTFERYCQIHKQAHKDLADYGEPMTEDKKVHKFIQGIRANYLSSAIATVMAMENLCTNFDEAVNFLTRFIEKAPGYRGDCQISSTTQFGRGGRGRGGRGRGQGRGRGHGGGRGQGRGRGG
jgi:hypothetical protein